MYVFVTGPMASALDRNVHAALDAADILLRAGHSPYLEHLHQLWHLLRPQELARWEALSDAWLSRAEMVLRLPGESAWADRRVAIARALGKPVSFSAEEIAALHFGGA